MRLVRDAWRGADGRMGTFYIGNRNSSCSKRNVQNTLPRSHAPKAMRSRDLDWQGVESVIPRVEIGDHTRRPDGRMGAFYIGKGNSSSSKRNGQNTLPCSHAPKTMKSSDLDWQGVASIIPESN